MKALVTGSTGFIGKNLCDHLRSQGFDIRTISRSEDNSKDHHICDLEKDFPHHSIFDGIDYVFHLAGYAHDLSDPRTSYEKYRNLNVRATQVLCQMADLAKVKSFIFLSSVKAGDSTINRELNDFRNIYGETKREAEEFLLSYQPENNMRMNIIRPALVYGPDMKGNLKSMLNGIQQGWFPPMPKLNNKRSMVHVHDLILAIMIVNNAEQSNKEIYIATDGLHYSTSDIYEILMEISGRNIPNYRFPLFLIRLIGLISSNMRHKIQKLLGDEVYDPIKLYNIGFTPKKSLKHLFLFK